MTADCPACGRSAPRACRYPDCPIVHIRPHALPPLMRPLPQAQPFTRSERIRVAIVFAVVAGMITISYWPLVRRWIGGI